MQISRLLKTNRINIVLLLITLIYTLAFFFEKPMVEKGMSNYISFVLHGIIITIMLPSLFKRNFLFNKFRYFIFSLPIYFFIAYLVQKNFDLSVFIKSFLTFLSFIFFSNELMQSNYSKKLLISVIIAALISDGKFAILNNNIANSLQDNKTTNNTVALNLILLIPLLLYSIKGKISVILYLINGLLIFLTLRRTAMLIYIFSIPFAIKLIRERFTKKNFIFMILILACFFSLFFYYYSDIFILRFSEFWEGGDKNGNYGSGRTGWYYALIITFIQDPLHWFFGFGLGSVVETMKNAGYPFSHAHNDYLELLYTYGLWGLISWLYLFKRSISFCKILKRHNIKEISLLYYCIYSYIIMAFMSGFLINPKFLLLAFFISLIITNSIKQIKYNQHNQ